MFAEIRKKYLEQPSLFPFVVVTVGKNEFQHAMNRPNGYGHHHVLMIEEGEGCFCIDGKTLHLSAGEGVFCRAGVPHSYTATGDVFRTCWVTFGGGEGVLNYYCVGDYFRFRADPLLLLSVEKLEKTCIGNSTILNRSAAGYTWFTEWLHGCFAPTAPISVQVRRYLEAHFDEPLTLDDIAEEMHISRYSLCHYYKEKCKTTVMEQLKSIRIEKAKQQLRLSNASIDEIGKNCGFASPSYFGKIFRQETGYSPREYRNR